MRAGVWFLLLLAAGMLGACGRAAQPTPASQPPVQFTPAPSSKRWNAPPPMRIDINKRYQAILTTTEGEIVVELFPKEAPKTANNFVFLAREGFYDGVKFHRIIKGFMVQTGDPTGTGAGGPGYTFEDEPVRRDYTPGIVAMANAGPNTNGSQFFIMHGTAPLPKAYTIFGQVVQGMEVVDRIANTPVTAGPGGEVSRPTRDVRILKVTIREL
ncbi:MAG: peptidylprolyl isomerase [Dehalococcoidia bacterium]